MKNILILILLITNLLTHTSAQEDPEAKSTKKIDETTFEEKEQKLIDYSNIKNVLINDGLEKQQEQREKLVKQIKVERKSISKDKYFYPTEEDFWDFISELWLVKNAQILSWDFPKPEYGIDVAFKNLLEKLGYFNKHFKILIVNTPTVVHFGLPAGKDSYIFLLSLPFVRSLDLTKVDIALVLLEDFFRLESKTFINNLKVDTTILGTNFYDTEVKKDFIQTVLKNYSRVIFDEGFDFQQQYEVTKEMDRVLKSDPALWGAYFRVINKIDKFIKSDLLYQKYLKIYPSPELQIQWLSPKKKVI